MTVSEWDDCAGPWDGNADVQIYSQKAFDTWQEKVAPLFGSLSECRVLDFGCGTGLLTEKIAACCGQVVAIDTSEKMIDVLKSKIARSCGHNIVASNVAIDAESSVTNPLLVDKFDLIVASSVCSFLSDYESTLHNLSLIMKPGAYFVQWDWMEDMPEERIKSAFSLSGLIEHTVGRAFSMSEDGESMLVVMGIGRTQS